MNSKEKIFYRIHEHSSISKKSDTFWNYLNKENALKKWHEIIDSWSDYSNIENIEEYYKKDFINFSEGEYLKFEVVEFND
jgi:hypothetical protein